MRDHLMRLSGAAPRRAEGADLSRPDAPGLEERFVAVAFGPLKGGGYFWPNWLSMPPASISIGGRSFVSAR